jgi:hypothetical protein
VVIDNLSVVTNAKITEGFLSQEGNFGRSTRALSKLRKSVRNTVLFP